MAYPFTYTDLNVDFVRLSERHTWYYPGGIAEAPSYDLVYTGNAAPLSDGRVAVAWLAEVNEAGPGSSYDSIQTILYVSIMSGITELGSASQVLPNDEIIGGWSYPNYGTLSAASTGNDQVVLGASLFNADFDIERYWGALWLDQWDCSGSTPVLVDQYVRENFTTTPIGGQDYPGYTNTDIVIAPLDDNHVIASLYPPDLEDFPVNPEGVVTIVKIRADDSTGLEILDNGYPRSSPTEDLQGYAQNLGYNEVGGVFNEQNDSDFCPVGFVMDQNGIITFGEPANPDPGFAGNFDGFDYDGDTWFFWGDRAPLPLASEPGVFYAAMFTFDAVPGNPIYVGKLEYDGGGGEIQLVDIAGPFPEQSMNTSFGVAGEEGSWWSLAEYNSRVVLAMSTTYLDPEDSHFYEDLWIIDDVFGTPIIYRVSSLVDSSHDKYLVVSGGRLHLALYMSDLYDHELLFSGESDASPMLFAVVYLAQPDIDGELVEQRRKFWRPRPGW